MSDVRQEPDGGAGVSAARLRRGSVIGCGALETSAASPSSRTGSTAPTADDDAKEAALLVALAAETSGVVVAFSGGVDSSYVLWAAVRAAGPRRVRAVMGVSASVPAVQRAQAQMVASSVGVPLEIIDTAETSDPRYLANAGNRCFFCKDELYSRLDVLAADGGRPVLDGTNADDVHGHRPGHAAARTHAVRSPLLEHGLGKAAIRRLSRRAGLATADLPSSPCLASRFPAGVPVTVEGLKRVEQAEDFVRGLGFVEFRVRHHDEIARLEVRAEDLARLLDPPMRSAIESRLREIGYRFVSVDLAPFASGRGST
jgi:pyridinium-3,5-biscarboxylic acid mononucleotide sulfurtransferase